MKDNGIFANNQKYSIKVKLGYIWEVNADKTYIKFNPPAENNHYVALRTVSGKGLLQLKNGISFHLEKDTLIFLDVSTIDTYKTFDDLWEFYWFQFEAEKHMIPTLDKVITIKRNDFEKNCTEGCIYLLKSNLSTSELSSSSHFASLLLYWKAIIDIDIKNVPLIEDCLQYIHSHIEEPITIQGLSICFNLSERSLREKFKEYTGQSPKKYILEKKLFYAMELLQTTNKTISEIAEQLNFSSPYHLSVKFKERFGQSPFNFKR